jgi:hypothetical protein
MEIEADGDQEPHDVDERVWSTWRTHP